MVNEIDPYFWPTDNLTVCLQTIGLKNINNNNKNNGFFFIKHNATTGVVQLYPSVSQSITIVFCPHCTGRQSWLYSSIAIKLLLYRYSAGAGISTIICIIRVGFFFRILRNVYYNIHIIDINIITVIILYIIPAANKTNLLA